VVVAIIYQLEGHKLWFKELGNVETEGEEEEGDDDKHHPGSGGVGDVTFSVEIRPRKPGQINIVQWKTLKLY
jgi:hypothetical protein